MIGYADTGLLVSLYGRDANSLEAISLARMHAPILILTPFGEAEFANAIELRIFRGHWTSVEARAVHDRFLSHIGAGVFQLEEVRPETWPLVRSLSRRHSARFGTRMLDVLQVASALTLKPDAFFTFDERQRKLAGAEGLRVLPAGPRKLRL